MNRRIASILLLAVLALPALVAQGTAADNLIYDLVRKNLTYDPDVRGGAVVVVVKEGAVVLQGRVRDKKAIEKATKLAKKVKGVKSVDNQLKLAGES